MDGKQHEVINELKACIRVGRARAAQLIARSMRDNDQAAFFDLCRVVTGLQDAMAALCPIEQRATKQEEGEA